MKPSIDRPTRALLALLPALLAAGCGDAPPESAGAAASAAPSAISEPAPSARPAGTWRGEVTGGYTGNTLTFTVAGDGATVADLTFEGHWDCADGIETATLGPTGSFPIEADRLDLTSVDPPDGGATATRFVLAGAFTGARAEGTLRVNLNALGCDTGELSWSATPATTAE